MSRNTSFGGFICAVLAVIVGCGAFFGLRQHFDKDNSNESETSVESEINSSESVEGEEENSSEDEQQTVITDLNFYSNPDNFTEVEVVEGEKLAGNVYRFQKTEHDMDGNPNNGFECYTILGGYLQPCQFLSSFHGDFLFGFNDREWDESDPLRIYMAVKNNDTGEFSTSNQIEVSIVDLGIMYNWVHTAFKCYVDVYFAPGSTITIAKTGGESYTLNVDELTWRQPDIVRRLVAKTS